MKYFSLTLMILLAVSLLPGCVTTGGPQMENSIYDTNNRVKRMEQDMDGTIKKLNETTAELVARVNESDQQTRQLYSMMEETQVQLNNMNKQLMEFKSTYYRQENLTMGTTSFTPGFSTDQGVLPGLISVEGPATQQLPQQPGLPTATVPQTPVPGVVQPATPAPPTVPAVPTVDATTHYQEAQRLYAAGDHANALTKFNEHLTLYPTASTVENAVFWKAQCHLQLGQNAEGAQVFQQFRTTYPNSVKIPYALHNQALCHYKLSQTAEASTLAKEVVANYPTSPAADQAKRLLQQIGGN